MPKLSPQGLESRCVSLVEEDFQDRTPNWIAALKTWVWTPLPRKIKQAHTTDETGGFQDLLFPLFLTSQVSKRVDDDTKD